MKLYRLFTCRSFVSLRLRAIPALLFRSASR